MENLEIRKFTEKNSHPRCFFSPQNNVIDLKTSFNIPVPLLKSFHFVCNNETFSESYNRELKTWQVECSRNCIPGHCASLLLVERNKEISTPEF